MSSLQIESFHVAAGDWLASHDQFIAVKKIAVIVMNSNSNGVSPIADSHKSQSAVNARSENARNARVHMYLVGVRTLE